MNKRKLGNSGLEISPLVFGGNVFGWTAETNQMGEMSYTELKVDGRSIAGMMPLGPMHPPGTPPHWLVYFAVADTDATMARTVELQPTEQLAAVGNQNEFLSDVWS